MELGEDKDLKFMMACAPGLPGILQTCLAVCRSRSGDNSKLNEDKVSKMETAKARLCP